MCPARPGVHPRPRSALYRAEHEAARCRRSSVDVPVADASVFLLLQGWATKRSLSPSAAQRSATSHSIGTRGDESPMNYSWNPEKSRRIALDYRITHVVL